MLLQLLLPADVDRVGIGQNICIGAPGSGVSNMDGPSGAVRLEV